MANSALNRAALRFFQTCKHLKVFNLTLTKFAVSKSIRSYFYRGRQYSYQKEPAATKFNQTHGFDELMSMRALERVTVSNIAGPNVQITPDLVSDEEIKVFEDFLNRELTKPRKLQEVDIPWSLSRHLGIETL